MPAAGMQPLKVDPSLRALLGYVGRVRGGLSPRQVGEELLLGAIRDHPVGGQMLELVGRDMDGEREGGEDG